jgi:DNA-binding NarL/FixJ family response regulator
MIVETSLPQAAEPTGPVAPGTPAAGDTPASPVSTRRDVTLLVVEDSPLIRERLIELVGSVPHVSVVGAAADGHHASALFQHYRPDAVVLDLELPGIHGIDLLAQFKQEHPSCSVMVLTTYAFPQFRQRCAKLGADYFLHKATEFERVNEVLSALQSSGAV